jgi:hypothetical protein
MIFGTKHVIAAAALIAATGIAGIEMTRDATAATQPTQDLADQARSRVDAAFVAAAEVPPMEFETAAIEAMTPAAEKTDKLPVGCDGPFKPEVQAECVDVAYEVSDATGTVVESRIGESTSVLMRLDQFDMAHF